MLARTRRRTKIRWRTECATPSVALLIEPTFQTMPIFKTEEQCVLYDSFEFERPIRMSCKLAFVAARTAASSDDSAPFCAFWDEARASRPDQGGVKGTANREG